MPQPFDIRPEAGPQVWDPNQDFAPFYSVAADPDVAYDSARVNSPRRDNNGGRFYQSATGANRLLVVAGLLLLVLLAR